MCIYVIIIIIIISLVIRVAMFVAISIVKQERDGRTDQEFEL